MKKPTYFGKDPNETGLGIETSLQKLIITMNWLLKNGSSQAEERDSKR